MPALRLAVLATLLAACTDAGVVSLGSGEVLLPERVDFLPTALNFPRTQAVHVVNRSRVARSLTVATEAPFSAPSALEVPGGAEVELAVVFTPTALGLATGTLFLDEVAVAVTGEGVEPLDCGPSGPCDEVRFDPESLSCVHTVREEGASCSDELQCIEEGACRSGVCAGRAASCDDHDACTNDSCALGRGCQHTTNECAAPSNPCLAPTCDPLLGCGSAPVQDGTPCGAVSCTLANICLAGTCRAVVPPEGFTCSPQSACRGEGTCQHQACVVPPETDLHPRWSYVSSNGDLRFEGVTDAQGNWYWVECGGATKPTDPTFHCFAISATPEGFERFRTDVVIHGIPQGVARGTQLIAGGKFIFVADAATLVAIDVSSGALAWQGPLPSQAPLTRINALAEDGHGALWVTASLGSGRPRSVLSRVSASTGAALNELLLDGEASRPVLDSQGAALVQRSWLAGPPLGSALERYEPDGGKTFSVPVPADFELAPAMVLGDRLVLRDDSVRSALDGAVLESAQPVDWSVSPWPGVAESARSRFRLSRSMLDSLPDTIGLEHVDSGARTQLMTVIASEASDLQLTSSGDALFMTVRGLWNVNAETRLHQVQAAGREVMSCRLVDDATLDPGWPLPIQLGGATGFNGRWFAVRTTSDCPACALWTPPRLVFFDLGRSSSPGVSTSGWVAPRGTPAGSSRAR